MNRKGARHRRTGAGILLIEERSHTSGSPCCRYAEYVITGFVQVIDDGGAIGDRAQITGRIGWGGRTGRLGDHGKIIDAVKVLEITAVDYPFVYSGQRYRC
ncbi:hypothetical protein D3C72_1659250 [compost metagenome]